MDSVRFGVRTYQMNWYATARFTRDKEKTFVWSIDIFHFVCFVFFEISMPYYIGAESYIDSKYSIDTHPLRVCVCVCRDKIYSYDGTAAAQEMVSNIFECVAQLQTLSCYIDIHINIIYINVEKRWSIAQLVAGWRRARAREETRLCGNVTTDLWIMESKCSWQLDTAAAI